MVNQFHNMTTLAEHKTQWQTYSPAAADYCDAVQRLAPGCRGHGST
jgi:hypothetical protein